MKNHDYSLEELADFTPYENYINAINDQAIKKKYQGQLEMSLNPEFFSQKFELNDDFSKKN